PGLGAAQTAYSSGAAILPQGVSADDAMANLSTAFAFTYCISMVGFIVLMKLGPQIGGHDLPGAARAYEASIGGTGGQPLPGPANEFLVGPLPARVRTYALSDSAATGHRLGDLRKAFPLLSIEKILRGGNLLEPADDVVLQPGDTIALYGTIPRL